MGKQLDQEKAQAEVGLSALLEVGVTWLLKGNAQCHGHLGGLAQGLGLSKAGQNSRGHWPIGTVPPIA